MSAAGQGGTEDFARQAGEALARLGVDADEAELAVMAAAESLYRPLILALLDADLSAAGHELGADLSRPPS